ncbi:hypothetical protein AAF712_010451 [Marasmius tenuissimus]|uniref:Uncharacterized protein n=1 Tax=Marasmius tenuissimus TaxID=585030 RepID=A0ABR2ZLZ8_9AGAR
MNTIGFSLMFQGTSVSVYFILANDEYRPNTTTHTECDFILDGTLEKSFVWDSPLDREGTEYNAEVFRKEGLENRPHTLNVETGRKDYKDYIAFDYATYTVEEPDEVEPNGTTVPSVAPSAAASSTSSSKSVPTGAIAGGVIGGLSLILSVFLVLFVCRKRRKALVQHDDGPSENSIHVAPYRAHSEKFDLHRTNTPAFRSDSGIRFSSPPVMLQVNPSIARVASYTFPNRNVGNAVSGLEPPSAGADGGSPTLIPTSGLSKEAPGSLMRQEHLDRTTEDSSGLELQGSHSDGGYHVPSDSRSGIVQGEMDELREQIRQLQAQIVRQEPQLAAIDTSPPTYTP